MVEVGIFMIFEILVLHLDVCVCVCVSVCVSVCLCVHMNKCVFSYLVDGRTIQCSEADFSCKIKI